MRQAAATIITASLWSEIRLAYGLLPVTTLLNKQGIDPGPLLDKAGIARFGLMDPAYTISVDQELAFMRVAIQALPDPAASLRLAEEYRLRGFSVLGLALQCCTTPLQMLTLILRYPRLAWGVFDCELRMDAQEMRATLLSHHALGHDEGFLAERDIACALAFIDEALEAPFPFRQVSFRHACRGDPAIYEAFFRCPVRFNSEQHSIVCSVEAMQRPLPHANATLQAFYEAQCERMSKNMEQPFRYAEAVRTRLLRSSPIPDLPEIASRMYLTPRTLQRRLASEAASFTDLLREVRRQRAEQLLAETRRSMESIATELGFSDAVAFSHAYKLWTGAAPRLARAPARVADAANAHRRTDRPTIRHRRTRSM